ncbi:MAG: phosphoribosyltransferase family protein [Candidatus Levybacteria bacterium]|nr:phosphoribosyltransferase family protein [Candidatus Levybacteria bacterium]
MVFKNREEASRLLSSKLNDFKKNKDLLIIAIPRGGVVLGKIISKSLKASLDIIVIKKIGAPQNPELAIGAIGQERTIYWDRNLCERLNISKTQMKDLKNREGEVRSRRESILREERILPEIKNKTVILVDDGVATGATVICAQKYLKKKKAKKIILAVPVISKETLENIKQYFDRVIFLDVVENFYAVGQFYKNFPQVSDEEVIGILASSVI